MMHYPKLNSLYKRDMQGSRRLILGDYACPEFGLIRTWDVTEKIDGMNIRITLERQDVLNGNSECSITFGGRTEEAQIPAELFKYLQDTFTREKMDKVFKNSKFTVLFGEGYGGKIQAGSYYRKDMQFVLFDVFCSGWWMERFGVESIAQELGIHAVPRIERPMQEEESLSDWQKTKYEWTEHEVVEYVRSKPMSLFTWGNLHVMEGIVARNTPMMQFRSSGPVMFKLKCKDFDGLQT